MPTKASSTEKNNDKAEAPKESKSNKLLSARHAATATLIANHKEEFDNLYVAEAQSRGVTYTPELTEEQKAAKKLEELIAANPGLEDDLRHRYGPSEPVAGEVDFAAPVPGDPAS